MITRRFFRESFNCRGKQWNLINSSRTLMNKETSWKNWKRLASKILETRWSRQWLLPIRKWKKPKIACQIDRLPDWTTNYDCWKRKKNAIRNHVQFSINFHWMIQKNTKDPANQPGRKHSEARIVFGSNVIDNNKISDTSRRWDLKKWTWKILSKLKIKKITISCGVDSLLACVYKKLGVFSASFPVKAFNILGKSGKKTQFQWRWQCWNFFRKFLKWSWELSDQCDWLARTKIFYLTFWRLKTSSVVN